MVVKFQYSTRWMKALGVTDGLDRVVESEGVAGGTGVIYTSPSAWRGR